jgi:hypothetical protein
VGVTERRSAVSPSHTISVATEQWTTNHRAFVFVTFLKNSDSDIKTQELFHRRFNTPPNGPGASSNIIKLWAQKYRQSVSALRRKTPGSVPTVRTPDNIENIRLAVLRSPQRSARTHATYLTIPHRRFRRILHNDLSFRPDKTAVDQELSDSNMANGRTFRKDFSRF